MSIPKDHDQRAAWLLTAEAWLLGVIMALAMARGLWWLANYFGN